MPLFFYFFLRLFITPTACSLGLDQHDAQASYMTTIYYCFLSATDKTKVPSVGEVSSW